MTIRLRFEDFDVESERVSLGGRTVFARDILSVQLQRRVSAALLGYLLIGGLLLLAGLKAASMPAIVGGMLGAALLFAGAFNEWRRPYVLVLNVYQLGPFEVMGIPKTALPALDEFLASL